MTIQDVFGDFLVSRFIDEYLHRLPFALCGAAQTACQLGSWDAIASMLGDPELDLMLARDGAKYIDAPPREAEELLRLSQSGWTVLVRHAERHSDALATLAAAFETAFRGKVDVHIYVTPPGRRGFSWHYDAEDVFILQSSGEKRYDLRKNTVHPWPLEETLPEDMRYEQELMPLSQAFLHAGDLLYIPCGYWHRAEALSHADASISLAIGVMSPAAIDVLELLRPQLVSSLVWRQRLPLTWDADATELYQSLLKILATDISQSLTSPATLKAVIGRYGQAVRF
jgi:50S ribosomal protein L16 3-hydroxylase